MINIKNKIYYLILGWGTCCGGKHYSQVKVYEIENNKLQKAPPLFKSKTDLYIGANRGSKIGLKYNTDSKILSYNSYGEMNDTGFYSREKKFTQWKLTKTGFKKIK